jgi:hypothetical protein
LGYAKNRDTRSRDYAIINNNFNSNPIVMNIIRSEKLNVFDNIYDEYETLFKIDSTVTGFDTTLMRKYLKSLVLIAPNLFLIFHHHKMHLRKLGISRKKKYYDDRMGTL